VRQGKVQAALLCWVGCWAMPKVVKPLTATRIERAKTGMLSDGGGLMLFVDDHGAKTWLWRYISNTTKANKKGELVRPRRDLTLGRYPDVGLEAAREEVRKWRAVLAQPNGDPHAAREQARRPSTVPTFGECADLYIETHRSAWKLKDGESKHLDQWVRSLRDQAKAIRSLPVNMVDTAVVISVVKPLWKDKRVTANRLRNRIELVLEMARADGHIPEDRPNPARWRGWLEYKLPAATRGEDKHFAAMPYKDVPSFLRRLRVSGAGSAAALEFVILTGVRVNEALGAKRAEFDLQTKIWTVPAARMKANMTHIVPLSDRACEIIRSEMDRHVDDLVFRGTKKGQSWSDGTLLAILKVQGSKDATIHGFRSSLRDWLYEVMGADRDLAEQCLAHTGAYRRGPALERRRALMDAWSLHCSGSPPVDNVVKLRA
jgi:integrase